MLRRVSIAGVAMAVILAGCAEVTTTETAETITTTTAADLDTTTTIEAYPRFEWSEEGAGDDVLPVSLPPGEALVIELTHSGSGNFSVVSHTSSGDYLDLLVNEIGAYSGTSLIQISDDVGLLEITADGSWSVLITDLLTGSTGIRCGAASQRGDMVVIVEDFVDTGGAADLTHNGESNFSIWTYGDQGTDLIVNEIGTYSGTVLIGSGMYLWEIDADGSWSIDC